MSLLSWKSSRRMEPNRANSVICHFWQKCLMASVGNGIAVWGYLASAMAGGVRIQTVFRVGFTVPA